MWDATAIVHRGDFFCMQCNCTSFVQLFGCLNNRDRCMLLFPQLKCLQLWGTILHYINFISFFSHSKQEKASSVKYHSYTKAAIAFVARFNLLVHIKDFFTLANCIPVSAQHSKVNVYHNTFPKTCKIYIFEFSLVVLIY